VVLLVVATMHTRICFLFVAWAVCWFSSNAHSHSNHKLTTGYRGNKVATTLGVELPIMLQLGVQRGHVINESRDGNNAKRKRFWKGNAGGPLPAVDAMRGKDNDGEVKGLGQSHKAMRYG